MKRSVALMEDVRTTFEDKGLEFVSLSESSQNRDKSILTYKDATGAIFNKEVGIRLTDLEETVVTIDNVDPLDIANFLLRESTPVASVPS